MPWTLARDFTEACASIRRDEMLARAISARAAQADGKDWERWVKGLEK